MLMNEAKIINKTDKQRMYVLDFIRIICAFLIFQRHSITMFGCTYSSRIDLHILDMTSPVMICFFVLSGFSLYYQYRDNEFSASELRIFYTKRAKTLLPSYFIIHILYVLINQESLKDWVALTPIELLGIQSIYNSLFGILHNGGTWFVSCMLFCYLLYPIIQEITKTLSTFKVVTIILGVYFIIIYSGVIVDRFHLAGNYANPFFRLFEFTIGVLISVLCQRIEQYNFSENKIIFNKLGGAGTTIFICIMLIVILKLIGFSNHNIVFTFLPIPIISLILFTANAVKNLSFKYVSVLRYFSKISYQFYLIQCVNIWKTSKSILYAFNLHSNLSKIIGSFILCLLCAAVINILVNIFYKVEMAKKH